MRTWMSWAAVTPFAVWAAIRWSGFEPDWPWVPAVAFTPYAAAAAVLALGLALLLRRRAAVLVALAAAVALGVAVLPRALPDGGGPAAKGPELRVLAANLMVGKADPARLVALVEELKPDVLALQELTPKALDRLEGEGLRDLLPHAVTRPLPGVGGSAVYARHPLTPGQAIQYGPFGQARAFLAHPHAGRIEVVSVHPCAPKRYGRAPCWRQGLEALPRGGGGPLRLLAGDFNATLDHLPVRDLLADGYRDAADAAGHGLRATWPQGGWGPFGVTIDHVLADERMGVTDFRVLSLGGTDHRPVFATLRLP